MAIDFLWGVEAGASDGPPQFAYDVVYDYDGSGNLIYIGWALSSPTPGPVAGLPAVTSAIPKTGPVTSGAYWAIKKLTYNASSQLTQVQWAQGNTQQVNIWDNRTTLSYQ